ncbi:hypothetical protein [Methanoplanus limicola]|uniref:Uncharacterized protein n=1 Tax=Methanoplanus limicola DSM 2279 TaxID=937775 RepID=H1YZI1_9EURY|nr:hypothetical protein [Methanoplanus limicola]EHQ36090.1 hypothetical protein Metlim_2003 [Methanoplanus limicola DSM 2279]
MIILLVIRIRVDVKMMRFGKALGTLNWKTDNIPVMGSEKGWITDSIRKEMRSGNGISKRDQKKRS